MILFVAALVSGCTATNPASVESGPTGEAADGEAGGQSVVAATSDTSSSSGATVGVSSTVEEDEIIQDEPSMESPSGVSVAEEPVNGEDSVASSSVASPSDVPFIADAQARGGTGYGADSILGVRYGTHEGYERVVIDLGSGGQPAGSVPEWTLSSPNGDGMLRIMLPSVSTTGVSDGTFSGSLVESFHVVRGPESGMFVDIFSESAFTYRVIELLDPARLVVDFKPSEATLDLPLPANEANTVLVEPRRGTRVGGSLTVNGYSRNPEAANTIILTDASGRELVRDTVASNDWTSTWGYFETTLDLPPFSGRATLKVGAGSARDGSFEGVEIPVSGAG